LLRTVSAQAFILSRNEAMPDGFDTVVGERGLKHSGSERSRIAQLGPDLTIVALTHRTSSVEPGDQVVSLKVSTKM